MNEQAIGALSTAAVIIGLAIMQSLPRPVARKAQEGAKWFFAALLIAWGVSVFVEDGEPSLLIFASLIVAAWIGRRALSRSRRAHRD